MRSRTLAPVTRQASGLNDCATQRNLSAAGRDEARRIGDAFRTRHIPVKEVRSSRWCRCIQTARLAFGRVEPWPILDSLFHDRSGEPAQTEAVRSFVKQYKGRAIAVLVTHGANISAITGVHPAQGEMVILKPDLSDEIRIVGRLTAP